jgi:hypothetical protein
MERRCDGPRVALDATAMIHLDLRSPATHSRIVNASPKGMLLVMPDARPVGTRIHVTVQLEDRQQEIRVSGIIVHCSATENVDPRFSARAGILLTTADQAWLDLCQELADK